MRLKPLIELSRKSIENIDSDDCLEVMKTSDYRSGGETGRYTYHEYLGPNNIRKEQKYWINGVCNHGDFTLVEIEDQNTGDTYEVHIMELSIITTDSKGLNDRINDKMKSKLKGDKQ